MTDFSKPCIAQWNGYTVRVVPYVDVMEVNKKKKTRELWELTVTNPSGLTLRYQRSGWEKTKQRLERIAPIDAMQWTRASIDEVRVTNDDIENCVYFIEAVGSGRVKIGIASSLNRRFEELSCASPFPLSVLATIPGGIEEETKLHRDYKHLRVHREWFLLQGDLLDFIDEYRRKS